MTKSSGLETPLLRVSRPVAACSRCRAAKIKCDGQLPACGSCSKAGKAGECSAATDEFAKGKERSYVASLETRIEKLERQLQFARLRKASVVMPLPEDSTDSKPRKDSMATIRAAIRGKAARRREKDEVNELVSDFGLMSVNATARDFESSTTKMTFAKLILAAATNEPMPRNRNEPLPPRSAALQHVQLYLDNIHVLFPAFPETVLFNAMTQVYHEDGRRATAFEHWVLFMVLGLGATSQSRSREDKYYKNGIAWVGRALEYADEVLVSGRVMQMQALVLLVQYSMLDPAHFDSWQLIGFACRAIVDLGFHQDPPKEQQPEKHVLDARRKLFWSIYALDRSISMNHARPFSFTDDAISLDMPASTPSTSAGATMSPLSGPHSMDCALLFFRLRQLQSSWYQELFQSSREVFPAASGYIWQMCQNMYEWSQTFPRDIPDTIRNLFDLELLYSYVYCLAPSCRVPSVSDYGKTLIYEYSIQYVNKIFPVSQDPTSTGFYTYHDALRVYFVGSQFLAVVGENPGQLLNGIPPYMPESNGGPPPPPLPNLGRTDNIERAIKTIDKIKQILKTYSERWIDAESLSTVFELMAKPCLAIIHQQQQHHSASGQHNPKADAMQAYDDINAWANLQQVTQLMPGSILHPNGLLQPGQRPAFAAGLSPESLGHSINSGSSPQALRSYSSGSSPAAALSHYESASDAAGTPQLYRNDSGGQAYYEDPQASRPQAQYRHSNEFVTAQAQYRQGGEYTGPQGTPLGLFPQVSPPYQLSPTNSYLGGQPYQGYQ